LLVFSPQVAVITLQPLPPLPPYVCSSRATPDKVLSILSVVVGSGASTLLAPLCTMFLFCFGGGWPLHKVQSLILCMLFEIPNARFTNSSPKAFLLNSSDVLLILRRSSHLIPEIFICSLPCSCCFRPRFHMPLLHSGPFQCLIPDVRPFGVLGVTLSWLYEGKSKSLCPYFFSHNNIHTGKSKYRQRSKYLWLFFHIVTTLV
jgi:hypothetical protein